MALEERRIDVYECPGCGELWFHEDENCCEPALEAVEGSVMFDPPEVASLAKEVFDISSTELVICRELMTAEEATVKELSRQLSRDRSIVQRHVAHLDELGLVEKRSRSLSNGGRTYVYAPKPVDEVHRRLQLGLFAWMTEAETRLEELNREKVDAMVQQAEMADIDDHRPTVDVQEPVVENGGVEQTGPGDDLSLVARLVDRWKSR